MNMKKLVGVALVVIAAVSSMVLTGCSTIGTAQQGSGDDKAAVKKVLVSGDWPNAGDLITVISIVGYETQGPYATTFTWRRGDEVKALTIYGGNCENGLQADSEGKGLYAVVRMKGMPKGVYFCQTK